MTTRFTFIAALSIALSVSACVQVSEQPKQNKNNQVAISSVRDLPISYPAGSTFALSPRYLEHVSFKEQQVKNIYAIYTDAIVKSLLAAGYELATNVQAANFHVGFGVALDEDLKESHVSESFGVSPGLHSIESMEKGSFLVFIEDTKSTSTVWRGAVQGYVQDRSTEQERRNRADKVVDKVMTQFYTEL